MPDAERTRKAIKVWMREVIATKGWSANEWARRAGTSPTNITRFMSPGSSIVPGAETLAKLARVAGTQPQLNFMPRINSSHGIEVPVIDAVVVAAFSPRQLWERVMDANASQDTVVVAGPVDGPVFVCAVPDPGMVGRGLYLSDRLLIQKARLEELMPGQVVLFRHESVLRIGEWQPPLVTFHPSPDRSSDTVFRPVRSGSIEVYGRVIRSFREW